MKVRTLHAWNVRYAEAVAIQQALKSRVKAFEHFHEQPPATPQQMAACFRLVAGADIAYDKSSDKLFGAVVVLELPSFETIEQQTVTGRATFPYIPGLLSFRELPVLLRAFEQLHNTPDAVLVDGQGLAHPRRFGIACHLGVLLDIPTVGCAKSRLIGQHKEPKNVRGAWSELTDPSAGGEVIGRVLRTQKGIKPIYVSVGHNIDIETAMRLALVCAAKYRLPEPTRRAHLLVNRLRAQSLQV